MISFVVLSWNTLSDTKNAIKSIRKQDLVDFEIVVVDNGSNDGSKEHLSKLKDIVYVDLANNTGFTGGQIEALKKCSGEYIALVNSDAILANNWAKNILETFKRHPSAAAVGGKAFAWNDNNPVYGTDNDFYSYQKIDPLLGYAETMQSGEEEIEVDSISGAGVMIRRDVIDEIGYFDNAFFAYYEETDLFARMIRAGYTIMYQPRAHLWHQIAKSSKNKPYFYLYQMHRNRFMYGYKNFDNPYAFTKRYFMDSIYHFKLVLSDGGDIDSKARTSAFLWNIRNFIRTSKKRKAVLKFGKSYSKLISQYKPGSDVTVVIPSYNYEPYIKDAIDSVFNQSHKPYRVVVIDDGSTDNSVKIAKSIKHPSGIIYDVISKQNEGVIATKNMGIKLSTTTWTIFLDADDVLDKDYIKLTLDKAFNCGADVVYTDMHYFGARNGKFAADDFSDKRLIEGNFIHNSALINTTLLKRSGGYKSEMHDGYEDWELYLSLAEAGAQFFKCTDTYLNYRQHNGGLSRNQRADRNGEKIRMRALSFHSPYIIKVTRKKTRLKKILKTLVKNPEILLMMPFILLYSIIRSLKEYISTIRIRFLHITRTYLHNKSKS